MEIYRIFEVLSEIKNKRIVVTCDHLEFMSMLNLKKMPDKRWPLYLKNDIDPDAPVEYGVSGSMHKFFYKLSAWDVLFLPHREVSVEQG